MLQHLLCFPKNYLAALAILGAIGLSNCNKSNSQSAASKNLSAAKTDAPVIEFRRTPCYGTCPVYRTAVSANGRIRYTGQHFTEKIGDFEASLEPAVVSDLIKQANDLNVWKYDSLYVTGATDFPSLVLTIRDKGRSKTIRTEGEGPREIESYMKRVDEIIMDAVRQSARPVK